MMRAQRERGLVCEVYTPSSIQILNEVSIASVASGTTLVAQMLYFIIAADIDAFETACSLTRLGSSALPAI